MTLRRQSACALHRAALLDFIDRRERGSGTDVALAHLDRCRSCETELSEIALAITALRRIRAEVQLAEPSRDAWERVRRVAARRPAAPWRWRVSLGTTVVAAALVAVVVMPTAFGSLAAPWPPIAGGDASATLDGARAGGAPAPRIYDPPARALTARVVTILAGDAGLDRPREARALTFLPAATDRSEVQRARRGAVTITETLTRAATRE
jgi:hypothetical protein